MPDQSKPLHQQVKAAGRVAQPDISLTTGPGVREASDHNLCPTKQGLGNTEEPAKLSGGISHMHTHRMTVEKLFDLLANGLIRILMAFVALKVGCGKGQAQDTRLREQGRHGGHATALQPMDHPLGRVDYSPSPGSCEIRPHENCNLSFSYSIVGVNFRFLLIKYFSLIIRTS